MLDNPLSHALHSQFDARLCETLHKYFLSKSFLPGRCCCFSSTFEPDFVSLEFSDVFEVTLIGVCILLLLKLEQSSKKYVCSNLRYVFNRVCKPERALRSPGSVVPLKACISIPSHIFHSLFDFGSI